MKIEDFECFVSSYSAYSFMQSPLRETLLGKKNLRLEINCDFQQAQDKGEAKPMNDKVRLTILTKYELN